MRKKTIYCVALVVILALTALPPVGHTQRLYNPERDEQAQKAAALAEPFRNGEIFDRQLRNLSSLAKRDIETEFLSLRMTLVSDALNVTTWGKTHRYVCALQVKNTESGLVPKAEDIKRATAELKTSLEAAKTSLKAFQEEVKKGEVEIDPALVSLFDRLGNLQEVKEFADALSDNNLISSETVEAIGRLKEITDVLKSVYDTYQEKVKQYNALAAELSELRVVLKKVAIQSLQVDEEHLKNVAAIRARRETERAEILSLISQYKGIVSRLEVINFDEKNVDPARRVNFCDEVAALEQAAENAAGEPDDAARPADFKFDLIIAEHLKEIVRRAKAMEEDNQTLMSKAKLALAAHTGGRQAGSAIAQTVAAIEASASRINAQAPVHRFERETADELLKLRDRLKSAPPNDKAGAERALRALIVRTQRNTIRNRDMVGDIPQALYVIGTLIARGSSPSRLADLRLAQELHAYSIRKSAVRARAYELTVSTGAKRLALFHKGGIKPTDVAELVFAVSNVAISPAILAR